MKTIKKGRKGWAQELECTGSGNGGRGCHAKLLVEQQDVYRTKWNDTITYHTFKCQECGVETDIPDYVRITFNTPTKTQWLERNNPPPREPMSHPYREKPEMKKMVELTEAEVKKAIGFYVAQHGLIEASDESKANMAYRITIQEKDVKLTSLTYWIEEDAP